jgi:hypothetical protein
MLAFKNACLDNGGRGRGMATFRRKIWLRILIVAALGLATVYGVYLFTWLTTSREEIAEADRLDPGWRLEEMERKRQVIPDEENGALVVLAASKLWPFQQVATSEQFWAQGGIEESIIELPPQMQLNTKQQAALKDELEKLGPLLQESRRLLSLPDGRFATSGSREDGSAMAESQEARRIAGLLNLHSVLQAQDNQADKALATALGVLNAGRSIGDEPYTFSQLVRMGCEGLAIRNSERVLAQGEPENDLESAQQLVENEARQQLLLMGVRGDRADTFQKMAITKAPFWQPLDLPGLFRLQTKCVEAAKAPPEQQLSRVQQLKTEASKLDPVSGLWFSSFEKVVKASVRNQAWLRCAYVGLAVERYRQAHHRWPDSLAALAPEFLHDLPSDPYNGSPLKYRRLDDGVVIYSVGPDGQDDGGKLDRQNPTASGTDIGFQLWDIPHRRQPWRPPKKKAEAED